MPVFLPADHERGRTASTEHLDDLAIALGLTLVVAANHKSVARSARRIDLLEVMAEPCPTQPAQTSGGRADLAAAKYRTAVRLRR
jgi:hypothetical protein